MPIGQPTQLSRQCSYGGGTAPNMEGGRRAWCCELEEPIVCGRQLIEPCYQTEAVYGMWVATLGMLRRAV